jgi:hypothetical protein
MFVLECNVAGVTYEPYKSNLHTLLRYNGFDAATYSVVIGHNPHNPHDTNAIEIYLRGSKHHACQMVGFIPRIFTTALLNIGIDKIDASLLTFNHYYNDVVGMRVMFKEMEEDKKKNKATDKLTKTHRVIQL